MRLSVLVSAAALAACAALVSTPSAFAEDEVAPSPAAPSPAAPSPAAPSPAAPPPAEQPALLTPPPPPLRQLSLTLSPVHLALPVFELAAELALQPDLSVAVIGGYGKVDVDLSPGKTESVPVFELGAQARYYLLGDFEHGLQLGAEALFLKASLSTEASGQTVTVTGQGLAVGPFLGYKVVSRMGFTFDTQLGVQYAGIGAEGRASGGQTASARDSSWAPLLNINLGWTF